MFESIGGAARSSARSHTAATLLTSLLVHATVVVALFTITFTVGIAEPPLRLRAVTLLAPAPVVTRTAVPLRVEAVRPLLRLPRLFLAPSIAPAQAPHRELMTAPSIDIPRPLLPAVELQPIAAAPAPPLRIDNLTAPVAVAQVTVRSRTVQSAGFASATPAAANTRGALRPAGFASASTMDDATPRRLTPPLSHSGFGDATVSGPAAVSAAIRVLPVTRPVEILSKPKPAYTEEARLLKIEGEVSIEILFSASGQVRVLKLVRGLGHGLDESAIAAAEAIRFRPAERAGVPVDSTAVVHIAFQLAY